MNKTLIHIFRELGKHYKKLILVFLAIILISSSMLSMGGILRELIDNGITKGDITSISRSIIHMSIAILILGIGSFMRSFYINIISTQIVSDIRVRIYGSILKQKIQDFDQVKISDYINRFSHDINLIGDFIINFLSFSMRNIITFTGGVIMMFLQNFKLSLITMAILPVTIILVKFIGKKIRKLSVSSLKEKASLEEVISETLNNIKIIYTLNIKEYRNNKLLTQSEEFYKINGKYLKIRALFFASAIIMVTSVILTVIWIGGIDVSKGNISSGNMISFVFYALMVAFSIGGMSEVFGEMQKYLAGAERVFEIEKLTDNNKKETDTKLKPPFSIDFEVNSFSYPSRPDVQIIKKICLTGKPGEFIGIVGPSGSGKSTILQIIMGIYTAKNSKLKINNQEIDLSIDNDLRSKIAYIPQDPFLFSSTIEENITLGRDCGSLEEVIKICGLSEMLDALPNGLKTYVGERGAQLSGGQKQRISIARSLYGKPEMLLMDEATSALDNESEVKLLSQLKAHMKDKIIISIAHRLSSITDADKILLISDGEVVANGSHKELIRSSALYSNLAKQNS